MKMDVIEKISAIMEIITISLECETQLLVPNYTPSPRQVGPTCTFLNRKDDTR